MCIRDSVNLLKRAPQHNVVHGSKAVGEPPFMLGIGVIAALRKAIAGFAATSEFDTELKIPCTAESVLRSIERTRSQ